IAKIGIRFRPHDRVGLSLLIQPDFFEQFHGWNNFLGLSVDAWTEFAPGIDQRYRTSEVERHRRIELRNRIEGLGRTKGSVFVLVGQTLDESLGGKVCVCGMQKSENDVPGAERSENQ